MSKCQESQNFRNETRLFNFHHLKKMVFLFIIDFLATFPPFGCTFRTFRKVKNKVPAFVIILWVYYGNTDIKSLFFRLLKTFVKNGRSYSTSLRAVCIHNTHEKLLVLLIYSFMKNGSSIRIIFSEGDHFFGRRISRML